MDEQNRERKKAKEAIIRLMKESSVYDEVHVNCESSLLECRRLFVPR